MRSGETKHSFGRVGWDVLGIISDLPDMILHIDEIDSSRQTALTNIQFFPFEDVN